MQPIQFNAASDALPTSTIAVARKAFFRGELGACLEALDSTNSLSAGERREAILLRARVLLRRYQFNDAIALLTPVLPTFGSVDEACTARMLHGIAVARGGEVERGLALLNDLGNAARTLEPHPTIRAEIAYWTAFAYWLKRDYRSTLECAVVAEEGHADVISVRAATLRGYVAAANERYPEALKLFRWALEAYWKCRERDDDLVGRIALQISTYELALRSATVAGTHDMPPGLARVPDDCVGVPVTFRLQMAAFDAWLYALDGERRAAYDMVRRSENLAPTNAWRVWALANRALISNAFGDVDIAYVFAKNAAELSADVDWNATCDEERIGLLLTAEALSRTDPASAGEALGRYDDLTSEIDHSLLLHDDVRLWILETWVHGLVARIEGAATTAWQAFKEVYDTAKRLGLLWQAAQALIELDTTLIATRPRGDAYLQAAALLVRANFPHSFLARRLGWWARIYSDPIATTLSPKPREVLRHYLSARSAKEIASLLGISEHTIKDYTETLFRAFSVHSKEQLLVACYERGIGSPSWWDATGEPNPPSIAGEKGEKSSPKRRRRKATRRAASDVA
ncbi:MAG: hypothetical protein JO036_04180 [Candidatus Eremiobacteraeota bacterium]|nr:hypothetical protein [Candidatus Eremiobacteraeota bacterium]